MPATLGIPAAEIVDIDVLKEGGTNWTNILSGASIPDIAHGALATLRAAVKQAMDNTGRDITRDGGIKILDFADQEAARNLLEQLVGYGTCRGSAWETGGLAESTGRKWTRPLIG